MKSSCFRPHLVVWTVADAGRVQRLGAEAAAEAVAVVEPAGRHHLLRGKHFTLAPVHKPLL